MYAWDVSRQDAIANYKVQAASMHSLTASMVGKDLKLVDS